MANISNAPGTLHLLPTGEGKIIKHTKYGTYVLIDGVKLFIPKTSIDIEQLEKEAQE
jgi:ribosomal protein S1